jgi:hypothetical protein
MVVGAGVTGNTSRDDASRAFSRLHASARKQTALLEPLMQIKALQPEKLLP